MGQEFLAGGREEERGGEVLLCRKEENRLGRSRFTVQEERLRLVQKFLRQELGAGA